MVSLQIVSVSLRLQVTTDAAYKAERKQVQFIAWSECRNDLSMALRMIIIRTSLDQKETKCCKVRWSIKNSKKLTSLRAQCGSYSLITRQVWPSRCSSRTKSPPFQPELCTNLKTTQQSQNHQDYKTIKMSNLMTLKSS